MLRKQHICCSSAISETGNFLRKVSKVVFRYPLSFLSVDSVGYLALVIDKRVLSTL